MNASEIGGLVLRLQDDDIKPFELRRFLLALIADEEIRRNARLAGRLSGLEREVRSKYCLANVVYLLSDALLAPTTAPSDSWQPTTSFFSARSYALLWGPWRLHFRVGGALPTAAEIARARRSKNGTTPSVAVSSELTVFVKALEEFWDVEGLLLA